MLNDIREMSKQFNVTFSFRVNLLFQLLTLFFLLIIFLCSCMIRKKNLQWGELIPSLLFRSLGGREKKNAYKMLLLEIKLKSSRSRILFHKRAQRFAQFQSLKRNVAEGSACHQFTCVFRDNSFKLNFLFESPPHTQTLGISNFSSPFATKNTFFEKIMSNRKWWISFNLRKVKSV